MARSINKVFLLGHLGKDVETKTFANGGAVANVSLATSESWKDKDGQQQERTEWHNLTFHNKLAEIAGQFLHKGSKVFVEGQIRTRKWQDKEGRDRYTTEIDVRDLTMLDSKKDGEARERPARAESRAAPPPSDVDFEDDSIPF